jgi:hypothetical protein
LGRLAGNPLTHVIANNTARTIDAAHENKNMSSKIKRKKSEQHGASKTSLYRRYMHMIGRCHRESHLDFKFYGGRGVKVCKAWRASFKQYAADVGEPPFEGAHLSRIDPTGDYKPGNVAWQTRTENLKSSRSVRRITTHQGEMTMADAARMAGKTDFAVRDRVLKGMAPSKAIIIDKGVQKQIAGKYPHARELSMMTIISFAREEGVPYNSLRRRVSDGMTLADAIHDIRHGRQDTKAAASRRLGISKAAITQRIKHGWTREAAMTTPKRGKA